MADVTVMRVLPATPDSVWRAWTDPHELAAWMWPPAFQTRVEIDLRPGGGFHVASPVAGMGVGGEYIDVSAPARLAFTWCWDGESERTTVTVNLAPHQRGCELTLVHDGFATDEARANHLTGWGDCLDRLPGHLLAAR